MLSWARGLFRAGVGWLRGRSASELVGDHPDHGGGDGGGGRRERALGGRARQATTRTRLSGHASWWVILETLYPKVIVFEVRM